MNNKRTGLTIVSVIFMLGAFLVNLPFLFAGQEIIRIGYFNLAPQVFLEKGSDTPTGAVVDSWEKHLAKEMDVKIKWVGPANIRRLTEMAQVGKLDAILVYAKNPERLKTYDFPENNFTEMVSGIALRKDHTLNQVNAVEDLKDITIGYQITAIIPPVMRKDFIQWEWNHTRDWKKQNLLKVAAKSIDGAFDAMSLSLEYNAIKYGLIWTN